MDSKRENRLCIRTGQRHPWPSESASKKSSSVNRAHTSPDSYGSRIMTGQLYCPCMCKTFCRQTPMYDSPSNHPYSHSHFSFNNCIISASLPMLYFTTNLAFSKICILSVEKPHLFLLTSDTLGKLSASVLDSSALGSLYCKVSVRFSC